MGVTRRRALALIAAAPVAALAACSRDGVPLTPGGRPAALTSPTSSSTAPSGTAPSDTSLASPTVVPQAIEAPPPAQDPVLPPTSRWVPGPGEVSPEIKLAAARFVEVGGTWVDGAGATASLVAAGVTTTVAHTASELEAPDAPSSTLQVRYPQYGGLGPDRAAVMTLLDQHLLQPDGSTLTRELALDVRLVRTPGGVWTVEGITPLTSLGSDWNLSAEAEAVLSDPRIELSEPARIDVATGRVDDRLLSVLLGVAAQHVIAIQVIHTGHIQTVYPTERKSNHAVGRAADIRTVDGRAVVDPTTPVELLTAVMVLAAQLGATEVGGPFDLNGERDGFFTDDVHQDHLHLGVSENKPPASL